MVSLFFCFWNASYDVLREIILVFLGFVAFWNLDSKIRTDNYAMEKGIIV